MIATKHRPPNNPRHKASLVTVGSKAFTRWNEDEAPRRGAALSYYTVFSLAPLVLIIVAIVGVVLGKEAAQGLISDQLQGLMGADKAQVVEDMIAASQDKKQGVMAGIIGAVMLLFGAGAVVGELQNSLMKMWGTIPKQAGWGEFIRNRLLSTGFVLGLGFLMLVSLIVSSAVSAAGAWLTGILPLPEIVLQGINFTLSLGTIALVFALLFKYLPKAKIAWSDVWVGAGATAVFFVVGNFLLGLYLGKAGPTSTYGAAGSLLALFLWAYYCAQILFYGAEFTRVYAEERGSGFGRGASA